MREHLQMAIATQIERRIFVNGAGVARGEVLHRQRQRLLVVLKNLLLTGVDNATDAGRDDIVDRCFFVVLFETHSRHTQVAAHVGHMVGIERLLIRAPFSVNEVEGCKTEHNWFFKSRHEHTHEADA